MRSFLFVLALLITAGSVMAADASMPEIWFFLRPYAMMAHGVDGQQGWQKLFLQPDAPWPPFMDHIRVAAFAGNFKTLPDDVLVKAFAKRKHSADCGKHNIPANLPDEGSAFTLTRLVLDAMKVLN